MFRKMYILGKRHKNKLVNFRSITHCLLALFFSDGGRAAARTSGGVVSGIRKANSRSARAELFSIPGSSESPTHQRGREFRSSHIFGLTFTTQF